MASGWTNKLRYRILGYAFRGDTIPTAFYVALITNAAVPDADTNAFSELTEIATGNGYSTGGASMTPGATDFDVWTEDDTNDRAFVQLKDVTWSASGGPVPDSGSGASYAVLTDDNGTVGSREVLAFWDLGGAQSVSDGQDLTLQDAEIRIA